MNRQIRRRRRAFTIVEIIGLLTPVRAWLGPHGFVQRVRGELDRISATPSGSITSSSPSAPTHRSAPARSGCA